MKATELLKEDHSRVDKIFKKVKDTPKGEHPPLFEQIKAELDVHTHIEETVFYPVLLQKGDKALVDITREGIEEHRQAKMFLEELSGLTPKNKQFEAKLKVLMEDIEHHVKEEEDHMFPMVDDQFTWAANEKLCARMEAAKAKFIKTMTPAEQKALERSLAAANEKSAIGKVFAAAKEVVTNVLSGSGIATEPAAQPAKTSGKAKTATKKAPAKKTAAAKKPAPKARASKTAAGRETKVKETIRKVQAARAQK